MDIITATGRPFFEMVTGSRCTESSNAPKLVLACAAGMGFLTGNLGCILDVNTTKIRWRVPNLAIESR